MNKKRPNILFSDVSVKWLRVTEEEATAWMDEPFFFIHWWGLDEYYNSN